MIWKLFALIFLWMAVFSFAVTLFLIIAKKSRSPWVKKVARRFGGEFSETREVRQGFIRFGLLFGALGILIFLVTSPGPGPSGASPFTITFAEAACVVVILWQGKNIWEMARAGREARPPSGKKHGSSKRKKG